jgi:pimeloyl-ACP methyl ester carboxylesterase
MPILSDFSLHPHLVSYLTLAGVLVGVLMLMCVAIVVLLARSLVRPPRMTDGKAAWVLKRLSPGDLGLRFEEVAFDVRDARTGQMIRIAGWRIPQANADGRTVILLHGYADAKVGAIAWAPAWHKLGWNILAIDLRALAVRLAQNMTGADYDAVRLIDLLPTLRCPVLVIAPEFDPLLNEDSSAKLKAALPPNGEYWHLPETGHLMALVADADEYIARLDRFLTATMPPNAAG